MALKSHKIALRPTDAQKSWFAQQCGYARFAYNAGLSDFKSGLAAEDWRSFIDLNNRFNKRKREFEWTKGMDQRVALYAIRNLSEGIKRWNDKLNRCRYRDAEGYEHAQESKPRKSVIRFCVGWVS